MLGFPGASNCAFWIARFMHAVATAGIDLSAMTFTALTSPFGAPSAVNDTLPAASGAVWRALL